MKKPRLEPKPLYHYTKAHQSKEEPVVKYTPYDGAELKPFTGRPGAMDAFKLPSRGM